MTNFVPTPTVPAPDIVRCAYMEIVVTDLAKSREFYVDVLGLHVTEEDENTIYLRSLEEFIHHNLVLRKGPIAAVAAFAYRVKSPAEVDAAEAYYKELGCRTERRKEGFTKGIGDSVRVEDPLGFPYEFFYEAEHVERLTQRYDLYSAGELVRLDHFNQVTPDVPAAATTCEDLGFRVSEDIKDSDGVTVRRVDAPQADRARHRPDRRQRPAHAPRRVRHPREAQHHPDLRQDGRPAHLATGSNAAPAGTASPTPSTSTSCDPDGHRVEIYTQDYYTGDPDNPIITWDVHDNQRRDWWGNPVVPSWYTEASLVLDLDGNPQPVIAAHRQERDGRHDRRRRLLLHPQADDGRGAGQPEAGRLQARRAQLVADAGRRRRSRRSPTNCSRPAATAHAACPALTARYPDMTVEDSYAVQQLWRRRNEDAGRTAGGPQDRPDVQGHAGRHRHHRAGLRRHLRRHGAARPAARDREWDQYIPPAGRGGAGVRPEGRARRARTAPSSTS